MMPLPYRIPGPAVRPSHGEEFDAYLRREFTDLVPTARPDTVHRSRPPVRRPSTRRGKALARRIARVARAVGSFFF